MYKEIFTKQKSELLDIFLNTKTFLRFLRSKKPVRQQKTLSCEL